MKNLLRRLGPFDLSERAKRGGELEMTKHEDIKELVFSEFAVTNVFSPRMRI